MFEVRGRPLRRSERIEIRVAHEARRQEALEAEIAIAKAAIEERQVKIAELKDQMSEIDTRRNVLETQISRMIAVTQKVADRDQQTVATLAAWLLTSSLAANLAGLWALISDKSTDKNSLFWAMIWFALGVLTSFVAGTVRLAIASRNWTAMIRTLGRAAATGDGFKKTSSAIEGNKVDAAIIALTAIPIGLFITGSIVIVCARLS